MRNPGYETFLGVWEPYLKIGVQNATQQHYNENLNIMLVTINPVKTLNWVEFLYFQFLLLRPSK